MGKAYTEDLRLKALAALDRGMKKRAVHQTFGVSRSTLDDWPTLDDWLQLRQQQGHVAPLPRPGRTGRGFFEAKTFEAFALRHCGATLGQMRLAWQREHGHLLSEKTFSNWLGRLGWTRKKRAVSTASETKQNEAPSSPR
jgi:transposase